jgi:3'(2'), 5'-bisphosphate nucleotidase
MSDSQLLEAMVGAAMEAGRAVQRIYLSDFEVRSKADASPVTEADHEAEAIILRHLARCAPQIPVVAEESVSCGQVPQLAEEFFLVDPLDGTKEFVARRGEFTVNIALVRSGAPVIGVVYGPATGDLYGGEVPTGRAFRIRHEGIALHGAAATRERTAPPETIRVRPVPERGLTAVASRSHSTPETEEYLRRYPIAKQVSIGSSLKFCLIAQGDADLYPRFGPTMEWDTAAGHAVLAAAGGTVVASDGAPLRYGKPDFRNGWFIASGAFVPTALAP